MFGGAAPEDERAALLAMVTAALTLGNQVAAKSLREGFFLSTFAVSDLPKAMLGAAVLAIPATLLLSGPMQRVGPARLAPFLFVASALVHVLEWAVVPSAPRAAAILVFMHVSLGGAILTSTFWSIVSERFDPRLLKRLVGKVGASATFGGFLGGAAMERVAHWLDARTALLVVAGTCVAAAASTLLLAGTFTGSDAAIPTDQKRAPFTGYLWMLALLVLFSACTSTFADVALKQAAAARFVTAESLVRFFALFYTGAAVFGFLLQALVSRRLLDTIGIAGTLTIPPFAAVLLGALSLVTPSLLTIGALRGGDLAFGSSLFRSAFEPLFTPLAPATKRATKALIDVVFDKGGDAIASACVLGVGVFVAGATPRIPTVLATAAAAGTSFLALRARRGYVTELETSLRGGTLSLDAADVDDATTRMTLSVTAFGIDRTKLLEQIARMRQSNLEASDPGIRASDAALADALVDDVRTLLGSDTVAIVEALARPALDPRLAAFIVPHLKAPQTSRSAVTALRAMGEGAVGVLSDAMVSPSQSVVVRRRIPYVLRNLHSDGAARALSRALSADILDVRYRAALALQDVAQGNTELLPRRRQVHDLISRELADLPLSETRIDHVFALLALCTPRDSVELARHGLSSDDKKTRGLALEYLESLLAEPIRTALVSALAHAADARVSGDGASVRTIDELKTTLAGIPVSRRPKLEDDGFEHDSLAPPAKAAEKPQT